MTNITLHTSFGASKFFSTRSNIRIKTKSILIELKYYQQPKFFSQKDHLISFIIASENSLDLRSINITILVIQVIPKMLGFLLIDIMM